MAKFVIKHAELVPSGLGSSVRATVDPRIDRRLPPSGEAVEATALAGVGSALAGAALQIGDKIRAVQTLVAESDARLKMSELTDIYEGLAATTEDPQARASMLQKYESDVASLGTTGRLKTIANAHIMQTRTRSMRVDVRQAIGNARDQSERLLQGFLAHGDSDAFMDHIGGMVEKKLISRQQGITLKKEYPVNTILAQAAVMAGQDPDRALGMLAQLHESKLTVAQATRRDSLTTHANAVKNRNASRLKKVQDKAELELYEKAYVADEPLSFDDVKTAGLSPAATMRFWNGYKKAQAEKIKTGISKFEEGDANVLAQAQAIVDLRPESITVEQLYGLQGKGLGAKYIPGLVTRREANLRKVDPVAKKYQAELSKLRTAGFLGDTAEIRTSERYLLFSRQLDAFLATKPSDAEAQRFFYDLIKEDAQWRWLSTSPSFWRGAALSAMFGVGADDLPRWGDPPEAVEVETPEGTKTFQVRFGTIVTVGRRRLQAIGRTGGEVEWLDVTSGAKVHRFETQAEFDALPSGAQVIGPDGIQRTKP